MCVAFRSVEVMPSPKFQSHEVVPDDDGSKNRAGALAEGTPGCTSKRDPSDPDAIAQNASPQMPSTPNERNPIREIFMTIPPPESSL
jgi:hypothetical protein